MLRPVRGIVGLLLALACASASGCGESEPSDEEQISQTVTTFARSVEAKDYKTICDRVLAPKLIEEVEQIGLPCEVALEKGFEDVRDPRLTVGAITVTEDGATAQVRSSAAGQTPSEDTLELVRVGDGWRIASLGADGGTP
jgi:hypothetical protein